MSPAIKIDRFEGSGGMMGCQLFRRPLPALTAHSSGRSPFDHFILKLFFKLLFSFFLFYFFLVLLCAFRDILEDNWAHVAPK